MNPSELVHANVSLQKLNQSIDDLVFLENAQKWENVVDLLGKEERADALEVIRAIALKARTSDIKALKEHLVSVGIEVGGEYIEKRLEQCRKAREKTDRSANVETLHRPQWGPNSKVN